MPDVKDVIDKFTLRSGLNVEKVLEHRSIEWSFGEESLLTVKVSGKAHPVFILFDSNGIKKWGYVLPCAKRGLKNEA